jgi:hypothetical protein
MQLPGWIYRGRAWMNARAVRGRHSVTVRGWGCSYLICGCPRVRGEDLDPAKVGPAGWATMQTMGPNWATIKMDGDTIEENIAR